MKKRKFRKDLFSIALIPFIVCATIIMYGMVSCAGPQSNEKVFQAYELRMNGQADSARVILEQLLSTDSTNALTWFELCRTTQHMGMANPRAIKETLDEALNNINKAIENDPNNAYYLSYKGSIETLQFYLALQTGNEKAGEYLVKLEDTYKSVFKLDPSYYEDKITLVEFFGGLPPEMGGDPKKAEKYARELEEADLVAGAKAREILMPEDADYEIFWKGIVEKDPENPNAHKALGRVYLFVGHFDEAYNCYQKAIDLDQSKNDLYLDLGRYYLMTAMQNPALIDSVAPFIEEQFNKFLNFTPEPNNPMKAWTYSKLAMISRRTGNEEVAEKYMGKADDLDPFYSPAFGKPSGALYSPPDVVVHEQGYFLSPF
jgi:tetratricopeptide (TPR) repeat protein